MHVVRDSGTPTRAGMVAHTFIQCTPDFRRIVSGELLLEELLLFMEIF